jgi:pyrroloquinoline-quinone synthase
MSANSIESSTVLQSEVRQAVEASLQRIREHPFIVEANAQRLSEEQARRWIKCAGRESRSFPYILENMLARCPNERVRQILSQNLDDERGNGKPEHAHFKHYLQLLDKLGIPHSSFYEYKERAGIKLALSLAYNISMQSELSLAIGYMLVNEGMTQITYSAIQKALLRYYPTLQTPFFDLHIEVDEKHIADLYKAVDEMELDQSKNLLLGITVGERGMAALLDEAYGLFDYCESIPVSESVV